MSGEGVLSAQATKHHNIIMPSTRSEMNLK